MIKLRSLGQTIHYYPQVENEPDCVPCLCLVHGCWSFAIRFKTKNQLLVRYLNCAISIANVVVFISEIDLSRKLVSKDV